MATTVKFGALAATNLVGRLVTQLTATSPAESAGTVNVIVTTVGGTSGNSTADQFTYQAPPAVTGVSPGLGSLGGRHDGDDHGHESHFRDGGRLRQRGGNQFTVNSGDADHGHCPAEARAR